jgi:hypothetical protein
MKKMIASLGCKKVEESWRQFTSSLSTNMSDYISEAKNILIECNQLEMLI